MRFFVREDKWLVRLGVGEGGRGRVGVGCNDRVLFFSEVGGVFRVLRR